jgi:ADP-ribosylglycohydrolase
MSKIYDGIMGLVVGDALGVPFEFRHRDTFKAKDMIGYGTHNQPAGTWSDDSSMTIATMASIVERADINFRDIMRNFSNWLYCGLYTPYGETFDVGNTTRLAIEKYNTPMGSIYNCGGTDISDNGNGSLMRILPFAFMDVKAPTIEAASALTHAHEISKMGCKLYVIIARQLLKGTPLSKILSMDDLFTDEYSNIKYLMETSRDEIRSSGYVVDTLEAALWCVLHSDSYKECVLKAVNLGGDTDTIAAVAGGLAGIIYGVSGKKGIPKKWIRKIAKHDEIKNLCEKFEQIIEKGR